MTTPKVDTVRPKAQGKQRNKKSRKSNPLYVVKKKGSVVEKAEGPFDAIIKMLNLEKVVEILSMFLKMLLEQVKSYASLAFVASFMDDLLLRLKAFFELSQLFHVKG